MAIVYGSFPGVRATVTGSRLGGVVIGRLQKAVLIGKGSSNEGNGNYNEPYKLRSRVDANTQFGANSELAFQVGAAFRNKAAQQYTWGVMVEELEVSEPEVISGSGTLSQTPIDPESITVTDTNGDVVDHRVVHYRNMTSDDVPVGAYVNASTGQVVHSDGSTEMEVTYTWEDWESAIDAADSIVRHGENGVYIPLTDTESVNQYAEQKVAQLRPFYKMINLVLGAEPNETDQDGNPIIGDLGATGSFDSGVNSDYAFMHAPVRLQDIYDEEGNEVVSPDTILGGIGGRYAGNDIQDPVVGEKVVGYESELSQKLDRTEQDALRNARVNPIDDTNLNGVGGMYINDNLSTSTATDWKRDYQRRRVVDQVLLIARRVGEDARNRLITDELLSFIENTIKAEIRKLIRVGVLSGSVRPYGVSEEEYQEQQEEQASRSSGTNNEPTEETPYFVEVNQSAPDEVSIVVGITPAGVNKRVDQRIIVEDFTTQANSSAPPA